MAENHTPTVTTPRENFVRRNFISECRDSRIIVSTSLSPRLRRIFRRQFDGFSRSAYLLRYYSQIVRENETETLLVKEIMTAIGEVNENLTKKIMVTDQLLENNSIKPKEPQFEEFNVTIIDPLANLFLQTFIVAQSLENKISSLWLACLLDDEHRKAAISDIDNELRNIQSKSRALSLGLRDRARAQRPSIDQSTAINAIDGSSVEELGVDIEGTMQGITENAKATTPRRGKKADVNVADNQDQSDATETTATTAETA